MMKVSQRYNESPSKIWVMLLKQIGSLNAYQLLCARPSADMRMYYTCCAHVT